jgi:hypothetical protein
MSNGRQLSSRAVTGSAARQRLEQLRAAGVEWVRILGSGIPGVDCDLCGMMKETPFRMDAVPPLPLPSCERDDCKCTWVPAEPPPEPKVLYYLQDANPVGPVTLDELLEKFGREEIARDVPCAADGDNAWRPLWKFVRDQEQAKLERQIEKIQSDLEAKNQELKELMERPDPK